MSFRQAINPEHAATALDERCVPESATAPPPIALVHETADARPHIALEGC
ncbi:hypothetical protein [Pararhizobium sp. LjRoot238]